MFNEKNSVGRFLDCVNSFWIVSIVAITIAVREPACVCVAPAVVSSPTAVPRVIQTIEEAAVPTVIQTIEEAAQTATNEAAQAAAANDSDYQSRWLMKPERRHFLGKSLLDPAVLVVWVTPNRPSP